MRFVVVLAALALLAGCGEDADPAAPPLAELTVTVNDGSGPKRSDVRCNAAADSEVCGAVAALKADAFEPTPRNVACTQIYGGPQTATVNGTLRGEPIVARFSRENGCEIARWTTVRPLLDAAG